MEKHTLEEKTARLAELEKSLAQKTAIVQRLIADKDKIIEKELHRHEEAAFYIRLQSTCFNLYPLLVRILLSMISDSRQRMIFRSIINGKNIHRLATQLEVTPEEVGSTFCTTVRWLSGRVESIAASFAAFRRLRKENERLRKHCEYVDREVEILSVNNHFYYNRSNRFEKGFLKSEKEVELLQGRLRREQSRLKRTQRENVKLCKQVDELIRIREGFWYRLLPYYFICRMHARILGGKQEKRSSIGPLSQHKEPAVSVSFQQKHHAVAQR